MAVDAPSDVDRRAMLAFVERYWRELTLRDARSLCVEIVDPLERPSVVLRAP